MVAEWSDLVLASVFYLWPFQPVSNHCGQQLLWYEIPVLFVQHMRSLSSVMAPCYPTFPLCIKNDCWNWCCVKIMLHCWLSSIKCNVDGIIPLVCLFFLCCNVDGMIPLVCLFILCYYVDGMIPLVSFCSSCVVMSMG